MSEKNTGNWFALSAVATVLVLPVTLFMVFQIRNIRQIRGDRVGIEYDAVSFLIGFLIGIILFFILFFASILLYPQKSDASPKGENLGEKG